MPGEIDYEVLASAGASEAGADDMIRVAVLIHRERGELIRMLTETLRAVCPASERSFERLREIEEEVTSAVELEELQSVKPKLGQCLEEIRRQSAEKQARAEGTAAPLAPCLPTSSSVTSVSPTAAASKAANVAEPVKDPISGLFGRDVAEPTITRAYESREPVSAVVVVLDNLSTINMRFGRHAGDEVVRMLGGQVAQIAGSQAEVYRWTGPAVLAVLNRSANKAGIREEFRQMGRKFEHTIQTASRAIHLVVAKRWTMLELRSTPDVLFEEIESFISPAIDRQ
jgi:GGDEF domain-containing protein